MPVVSKLNKKIMRFISLCVVALFCLGCVAGGGSAYHTTPEILYVGKATSLKLRLSSGSNKNVICHYKLIETNSYVSIKMQRIHKSDKYETYECTLPAFKVEGYVEYYFDFTNYGSYNKLFEKKVKIISS